MSATIRIMSKSDDEDRKESENKRIDVEYGDIIQIIAPSNTELHENIYFVNYIDETKTRLIHIHSREWIELKIRENTGGFTDESILKVYLLDRSEVSGYARQKGLFPKTWVDVYFRGHPTITGEITDLEEDRIEITTYPQLKILYIDFAYRGLPEDIPIERFVIREKPDALRKIATLSKMDNTLMEQLEEEREDEDEAVQEYLPSGESILYIPEGAKPDVNIKDILREKTAETKPSNIVFGDYLDSIRIFVEVPDSQKRYGIEMQITSYTDELLAAVPYAARTAKFMNNIHILVERYRELREMYSQTDATGNIKGLKRNDPNQHKPLATHLETMNAPPLKWVLPVTTHKRKYYLSDTSAASSPYTIEYAFNSEILAEEEMKRVTYFDNKTNSVENKYANMMLQINEFMTPYVLHDDQNPYLNTLVVNAPMESLALPVYDVQTHTMPFTKMNKTIRGGKTHYVETPIHRADSMTVSSLVMLPLPVMLYSRVGLPTTGILEKSQWSQIAYSPFLFMKQFSNREIVHVDDLTAPIQHMLISSETEPLTSTVATNDYEFKYLNKITEYRLNNEFMEDDRKYRKFLQAVLPNTYTWIRLLRKYLKNCFSFTKIVEWLEPFLIYTKDISYKQYMEIRYFIKIQRDMLKQELNEKTKEYDFYKHVKYTNGATATENLLLHRLLETRKDILDLFMSSYHVPDSRIGTREYSNHEILNRIILLDGGDLYSKLISSVMSSLTAPEPLLDVDSSFPDDTEKISDSETDCSKRVLAKQYEKITDLEKDNGTDLLYFDKELDETPYAILKKYEKEKKSMSPEKFPHFLAENLIQKHDCPRDKADRLAKILIEGKRPVKEGEYAALKTENSNYVYYVRRKTQWMRDETTEETEFLPTNRLFCNIRATCVKEPTIDASCDTKRDAKTVFQEIEKKQALRTVESEFERRYKELRKELTENIETIIATKTRYNLRLHAFQQILLEKTNHLAYAIGQQQKTEADMNLQSPYFKLKYEILSQTDFIKRAMDIVRFTDMFCRDPMVQERNEDPYWKYCEETNTKLLPAFLYTLAKTYVSFGQEEYEKQLQQIIAVQGIEEDGVIYDKYSDEIIQRVDFVMEETYNEQGFRVVTSNVMDKDAGLEMLKHLRKTETMVFENVLMQDIYTVYVGITQYLSDFTNEMRDQILQMSNEILEKKIPNEEAYHRQIKIIQEKNPGKKPVSFKSMRNKKIIQTVVAIMFMSIQTVIPSYKSNKIFPGCILSFDGYPMKSEENTRGIDFFACMLNKIADDFEPWNSIYKNNPQTLAKQLLEYMKELMENPRMYQLYEKKRNYLKTNTEEEIPEELSVKTWTHFLPALIDTKCNKRVSPLSSGFVKDFWSLVKKGHAEQTKYLHTMKSKIAIYGYSVIENIQEIVSKKELLLKSASRGIPFLQNACCNEKDQKKKNNEKDAHHPIRYFMQQQPDSPILYCIKMANELSKELHRIHWISAPPILAHPMRYKSLPTLPQNVMDENIYTAMIWYCGLDKDEIPEEMHGFFSKVPEKYNPQYSWSEKIQLLKEIKRFGRTELDELMQIVRKRNILYLNATREPNLLESFGDMIRQMEKHETPTIMTQKIRESLRELIRGYVPNKYYSNDQEQMDQIKQLDALKNELVKSNRILYNEILVFIERYGQLSNSEFLKIQAFLGKIHLWKGKHNLYEIVQFFKNAMYDLTQYLPGLMINSDKTANDGKINENIRIHKYWELSDADYADIRRSIETYTAELKEFRGETAVIELIKRAVPAVTDLYLFFKEMPVFSTLMKDREYFQLFDKDTVYMLAQHVLFSTIYAYISVTEDVEIKQIHNEKQKQKQRERIAEQTDVFQSVGVGEDVEGIGMDADEFTEAYENLLEVQIEIGQKQELNERVAKFILVFINMYRKNKHTMDYVYEDIVKKSLTNKTKEKERVIREKKEMKPEMRKIDNLHQKYSLGKWNVGLQKGIFKYDKQTSDRERIENAQQGIYDDLITEIEEERQMNIATGPITMENTEEDFDRDMEKQAIIEEINEMYDFTMGSEGYMDGNVYEEDRDHGYLE